MRSFYFNNFYSYIRKTVILKITLSFHFFCINPRKWISLVILPVKMKLQVVMKRWIHKIMLRSSKPDTILQKYYNLYKRNNKKMWCRMLLWVPDFLAIYVPGILQFVNRVFYMLFNDVISTTRLFKADKIGDSEISPRIWYSSTTV